MELLVNHHDKSKTVFHDQSIIHITQQTFSYRTLLNVSIYLYICIYTLYFLSFPVRIGILYCFPPFPYCSWRVSVCWVAVYQFSIWRVSGLTRVSSLSVGERKEPVTYTAFKNSFHVKDINWKLRNRTSSFDHGLTETLYKKVKCFLVIA